MNSNVVFRSHLMQQFVSAASSQVRPPIALAGASLSRNRSSKTTTSSRRSSSVSAIDAGNKIEPNASIFRQKIGAEIIFPPSSRHPNIESNIREDGSSTLIESCSNSQKEDKDPRHRNQNLLDNHFLVETVLDRAISACLHSYSQQKYCVDHPLVLRRFSTRSQISKFSDIAFEVTMKNQLMRGAPDAMAIAQRKKNKWSKMSAYMVALVGNQPKQYAESTLNPYSEIPYTPPETERQLQAVSKN